MGYQENLAAHHLLAASLAGWSVEPVQEFICDLQTSGCAWVASLATSGVHRQEAVKTL